MSSPNTNYFYSVVLGFILGIALGSLGLLTSLYTLVLVICVGVFCFLLLHSKVKARPKAHIILMLTVALGFASLGAMRVGDFNKVKDLRFDGEVGSHIKVLGTLKDDYDARDRSLIVTMEAYEVNGEVFDTQRTDVIVKSEVSDLRFGQRVLFDGVLERPKNFDNKFDYVSYLNKQGIRYVLNDAHLIKAKERTLNIYSILFDTKKWFIHNIEKLVPEPESALALGVTIAGKGLLPSDVKNDFVNAGLIHVVVLSGYNVSLVIQAMLRSLWFLGRRARVVGALIGVMVFVIIVGASAPVLRSAIMASIVLIGALSYTKVAQNRALFVTLCIMMLSNPLVILDASFILSFLATFAIVNVVPVITPLLSRVTSRFKIKETLAETLATQLFVAPYLLFALGRVSLIAPLSNLVILPMIPSIMMLTFGLSLIYFIPLISTLTAGALFIVCFLVIRLVGLFASIPLSSIAFSINFWLMAMIYIIYLVFIYMINRRRLHTKSKVVTLG